MEHVAIMKKSWGLLPKLLIGTKVIESRWLLNRSAPWNKVSEGDVVYFKNASGPIMAKARVSHTLQFDNLTPNKVHDILNLYGEDDGIAAADVPRYEQLFQHKKYCVLVFLEDVEQISPFDIDKRGFGALAAWITTDDVTKLRLKV